jgi:CBS domain-containing protein
MLMLKYKIIEIFTSEDMQWSGKPGYSAIIEHVNSLKIAARTIVTRGIEGSYESGEIATGRIEVLSYNMPVRIVIILPARELDNVLPAVQKMVTDGILTLRDQDVIYHRTNSIMIPKFVRVREIMTKNPIKVELDTSIKDVVELLIPSTFTGVPVVDKNGCPVGIITQGDLIYKAGLPLSFGLLAGSDQTKTDEILATLTDKKAGGIMSQPAIVIEQDELVVEAVNHMLAKEVKRLPVVDENGRLTGILSRQDIFHTILRECPDWRGFQEMDIHVGNLRLVSDITRHDTYTVLPDTPVDEVIQLIDCNDIDRVSVVDEQGHFLGLISDRDLLFAFVDRHPGIWEYLMNQIPFTERGKRFKELKEHLQARTAREVMKTDVVTVREDAPIETAVMLMFERVIKRLPVLDAEGRFKGMISRASLLRASFTSF